MTPRDSPPRYATSGDAVSPDRFVVGIGSNVDPQLHVSVAVRRLKERFEVLAVSSIYESRAVGAPGTPNFWNTAVCLRFVGSPDELKIELRQLEAQAGRVRTEDRNAPRPLDLDLVAALDPNGNLRDDPQPDPDLVRFHHVLYPVSEILPHAKHFELCIDLDRLRHDLGPPPDGFVRLGQDDANH